MISFRSNYGSPSSNSAKRFIFNFTFDEIIRLRLLIWTERARLIWVSSFNATETRNTISSLDMFVVLFLVMMRKLSFKTFVAQHEISSEKLKSNKIFVRYLQRRAMCVMWTINYSHFTIIASNVHDGFAHK